MGLTTECNAVNDFYIRFKNVRTPPLPGSHECLDSSRYSYERQTTQQWFAELVGKSRAR